MTRFYWAVLAGTAAVLAFGGAARAETFSLNDALGVAYESNPQLDAQRAALRATDEGVAQANAGWRPSVNAGGSVGTQKFEIDGVTGSLTDHPVQGQVIVNQPIFRGGRTYAEISRAKALDRAGRAQLTGVEEQVLLAAVTAYMDVVRDEAILDLRQHNVEVLKKRFDATQKQFDVGELTRTDVAQSQARLSGAQSDLVTAQGQLAISRANFLQVIGRAPETLEESSALPALPGSQDDGLNIALKLNPTLVAAKETERAADFGVDDSVGALLPQLSVQGQYQYSKDSFATGFSLGGGASTIRTTALLAQLSVPIYQGGADEASVRQAKQLHSQSQLNAVNAERVTRDTVASAWEAFQSAQQTIVSNQSQVKANALALEGVTKEQQVGGRTILDVLNAEQELLNSQVAVVTSQRNAEVAAYQLLAATGQLTAQNLGLKVKLYDPAEYYDENSARWFGFGD
ncbi:MAG TPA: TolC family outer membrane protein [Rhizomicrobium sp.]|nr:TolC family outer membrane protein [Rhizomicrobium sp.]